MIKGCISSRCKVISDKIEKVEMHLHECTLCPSHYDVDVRLLSLHDGGDDDDDKYIMVKCLSVCLSVTKNDHFLLGVSCNHLNHP